MDPGRHIRDMARERVIEHWKTIMKALQTSSKSCKSARPSMATMRLFCKLRTRRLLRELRPSMWVILFLPETARETKKRTKQKSGALSPRRNEGSSFSWQINWGRNDMSNAISNFDQQTPCDGAHRGKVGRGWSRSPNQWCGEGGWTQAPGGPGPLEVRGRWFQWSCCLAGRAPSGEQGQPGARSPEPKKKGKRERKTKSTQSWDIRRCHKGGVQWSKNCYNCQRSGQGRNFLCISLKIQPVPMQSLVKKNVFYKNSCLVFCKKKRVPLSVCVLTPFAYKQEWEP